MNVVRLPALLSVTLVLAGLSFSSAVSAQEEGLLPTQTLLRADTKDNAVPTASTTTLELNSKTTPVTALRKIQAADTQVALLIDDGLSRSFAVQLNDLRSFATSLPPSTELLVGYMTNGRVEVLVPFTTDHAAAAEKIRIPFSSPGQSASPYFCLSEFVKHWPSVSRTENSGVQPTLQGDTSPRSHKARFVMMITNGVDPYNGSTSINNQNSPYVLTAIADAQRAMVVVSSIYFNDAGMGGGQSSFSGQSYLQQLAEGTGGRSYYQGTFNPVALKPFLAEFRQDISETYIATFEANAAVGGRDHLVRLKVSTSVPKLKLRHSEAVRPGNVEALLQDRN